MSEYQPETDLPPTPLASKRIALNLDEVDREERLDPYFFVHKGRAIQLKDPSELDWQVVDALEETSDFLYAAMSVEDAAWFTSPENSMPVWKIQRLAEDYRKYFGVGGGPGKPA